LTSKNRTTFLREVNTPREQLLNKATCSVVLLLPAMATAGAQIQLINSIISMGNVHDFPTWLSTALLAHLFLSG